MDQLIGKKLDGRYQLDALIGVGGMANVYKATDLKHNRTVAVKVLRQEFAENEELVRRFKNESKAICILNHPNIVKVFDVSVTDKLQFIVMEYIDGITLKEYLNQRGGVLTWKETVHFARQVLEALEHAHSKGVVHRDIKPQNIMLLSDGSVKIMDFGIARFSRAESQFTSDKAIGSVHYISPEQAKGDVTDQTADIYSMGIMMYEMLSGKLPFESDSAVSVAIKQISDTAQPLSEVAPDVPQALQEIVTRAMAKDPKDRYPSARDMLDAIEAFKHNPSIRFEYEYLNEDTPERYISKVMGQTNKSSQNHPSNAQKGAGAKQKKEKSRKKRRIGILPILAGMAMAFAIGSAILCYMIFTNSTNPLFSEKADVELPDLTGLQWSDVEKEYKHKLSFDIKEDYNANFEEGTIFYQSPRGPRTVKEGSRVELRVSMGTLYISVPDVTQWKIGAAEEELRKQGLSVRRMAIMDDSVPVGMVIRTEPAAGEQIPSGDTISVYVSQERVETDRVVPQLTGLTLEDAIKALGNSNLSIGNRTEQYNGEYPAGTVIGSAPVEGSKVKVYSRVNLVISLGPEPTPEPTPEPEPEPTPSPSPSPSPEPSLKPAPIEPNLPEVPVIPDAGHGGTDTNGEGE